VKVITKGDQPPIDYNVLWTSQMVVCIEQFSHSMLCAMTLHLLVALLEHIFPHQKDFEKGQAIIC
jgi:hypothetical protein